MPRRGKKDEIGNNISTFCIIAQSFVCQIFIAIAWNMSSGFIASVLD